MSIVRYVEIASGQTGDKDSKYVRNYVRSFLVETSSKSDDIVTVETDSSTPLLWSAHPSNPAALCLGVSVRQADATRNGHFFEVTAKYSTKYDDQNNEDPLSRPVKQSLSFTQYNKAVDRDANDLPITNTSGDRPMDPVQIDAGRPMLRFVRNEAVIPVALALEYYLAVNSDTFYGAPAGTMRVNSISSGDIQTENDIDYYSVTYEIEYRSEGWKARFLNIGYNARTSAGKKIKVAGSEPRLLEAQGDPEPTGVCETKFTNTPEFVERTVYQTKAFSGLGL